MQLFALTINTATSFLNWTIYGNSLQTWLMAIALFLIVLLVLMVSKRIIAQRIRSLSILTPLKIDKLLAELIDSTQGFYLTALSIYAGSLILGIPAKTMHLLNLLPITALLFQCAWWGNKIIEFFLDIYVDGKKDETIHRVTLSMRGPLKVLCLLFLWSLLLLIALDNFGVNITTLIAGLGIGGVAVALAVQNILGDLLAALTIVIDKPFVVGDFIIVEPLMGWVEYVGMKTTRIRSVDGDLLIFPNSDLVKSRIRNATHIRERRVVFQLYLSPQTPRDVVAKIPEIIQDSIKSQSMTRFNRAHLIKIRASSLDFEIAYYMTKPSYMDHMNTQHAIYLAILNALDAHGIQMATPLP